MSTKVEARQWLTDHVGQTIHTFQTQRYPQRGAFRPGPRTLRQRGNLFYLNESELNRLGRSVTEVTVTEEWITFYDEDFGQTTSYSINPMLSHPEETNEA